MYFMAITNGKNNKYNILNISCFCTLRSFYAKTLFRVNDPYTCAVRASYDIFDFEKRSE